ncbi:fructokinase [Cribrihabitans marinus]|uniref:Fructokinase n=2 Tax=Cribrihabitans marinus TaxID=1227549 RepID=A0A1H6V6Q8_9RHOB|nr:carbohydrate kinase [Cribrihabitans marinus]GGH26219.1 carbohydrate kinase [Cribrihabitans marinus]SEJ00319.1 fructokinase [Cribrihabitans marinus]
MILCCGEALIDMLPRPMAEGAQGFVPHCGGSVFNTAIALGRLEVEAALLTGLSRDMWGRMLEDELLRSRVNPTYAVISDRPTTLAFVQLTDGHASYSFHDEGSASRMIDDEDLPDLPDRVRTLFFGGISLCYPPFCDTLVTLAEREARRRVIMLDPNIRPGFITDPGEQRARLARMVAAADVVKASDEDLAWLYPDLPTPEQQADAMLADGPAIVLLTRGGDGASALLTGGRRVDVSASPVEVVDTVGAGDTFNAGFLARATALGLDDRAALLGASDAELADCLGFAAGAAAVTVSRAGANPPWADEIRQ